MGRQGAIESANKRGRDCIVVGEQKGRGYVPLYSQPHDWHPQL
jgi:hypothetical protein